MNQCEWMCSYDLPVPCGTRPGPGGGEVSAPWLSPPQIPTSIHTAVHANPLQVNWSAVWMSYKERSLRGWIAKPLLTVFILIPVGIFSAAMMQLQLLLCPSHKSVRWSPRAAS